MRLLERAFTNLPSAARIVDPVAIKAEVASAIGVKPTESAGPLAIVPADVGAKAQPITAGFQRSVPSYMVMFVFLNLLVKMFLVR